MSERPNLGLLKMLLAVFIFMLATAYITLALSAQDLLWFVPGFQERPVRIVVYAGGKQTEYTPSTPGFNDLAGAVQSSLNQGVARPLAIGLSPSSLEDAYQKYISVEAFFDHPVKLHAWFDTNNPTRMLFLITGRHSELNAVLMGSDQTYLTNPPGLRSIEPLKTSLQKLHYEIP